MCQPICWSLSIYCILSVASCHLQVWENSKVFVFNKLQIEKVEVTIKQYNLVYKNYEAKSGINAWINRHQQHTEVQEVSYR